MEYVSIVGIPYRLFGIIYVRNSVLLTQYCVSDKIKKNEMGGG